MQLGPGLPDLTYCANVHPAEGWQAVFGSLRKHAPALRARLAPDAPLGIGLRLSAGEAEDLLAGRLRDFKTWLKRQGLYVALLDGYSFGAFHTGQAKDLAFAPDWRDPRRLHYTLRLAAILDQLLPEGEEGGISTIPLSARRWIERRDAVAVNAIAGNLVTLAQALDELRSRMGRLIHLDIDPEPGGLIAGAAETIAFFRDYLLPSALGRFPGDPGKAEGLIRRHVRLCYDACHFAVEYEDAREAFPALEKAGIAIGRVRVSSALAVQLPDTVAGRKDFALELRPLAQSSDLHQVVERRRDGSRRAYHDLPDALKRIEDLEAAEWRIHYHVPVFAERIGVFGSTQDDLRQTLRLAVDPARTRHLEIETDACQLLPRSDRLDLVESIEREHRWTCIEIYGRPSSSILSD